jgi:outer membrane biosynthesis protein TonB
MLLDERTGVEAPPEPSPTRTCSSCGGELADVQEWCLECGQRQPNRRRWTTRVAALVVSGVIVFAGGGTALAYVALRDDANNQSSKILAQAPQVPPGGETPTHTQTAPATPPPASTTPSTIPTTPTTPKTSVPKPPPLIHVPIHPSTTPTTPVTPPTSTGTGTTTGTTPSTGSTGTSNGSSGSQDNGGTTNTKPKRVKTVPKRPADAGQRYARGFSPTNAVDFDPLGDTHEDPTGVRSAIDRNLHTSWTTDDYANGLPHGVGLFVDAGSQVDLRGVELATTTPGWNVSIYGNASYPTAAPPGNGWQLVGQGTVAKDQSGIGLGGQGTSKFEYYLVWITSLPANSKHVTISEVSLLSDQGKSP